MMRPSLLAVAAAVAVLTFAPNGALASDLFADPFTPGGDTLSLDHRHPALGAAPPADSLAFAVVRGGDETNGNYSASAENREATSRTDIDRLEKYLKTKLTVNYNELRKYAKGQATMTPWPSGYWPTYQDGINYVWNAGDSKPPSEKYARAYGLKPEDFVKKITQTTGIESQNKRQSCSIDGDCSRLNDGSQCAKRNGQNKGYCVPTWYGICHAWAPAAIIEREPRCPVTKNGVTFQPFDIKALITQVYDGANLQTVFTGTRFNGKDSDKPDNDGRYKDATRRDLSAGFFHLAITNIMGKTGKSFVIDVDAGSQVWNQPVRSYEVETETELTLDDTAAEFFPPRKTYPFNGAAKKIMFLQTKLEYIHEANEDGGLVASGKVDGYTTTMYLEYVLELDGKGDIVGGEWVRASKAFHPDFLWLPEGAPNMNTVTNVGIKYKDVRELLDASADCKTLDRTRSIDEERLVEAVEEESRADEEVPAGETAPAEGAEEETRAEETAAADENTVAEITEEETRADEVAAADETAPVEGTEAETRADEEVAAHQIAPAEGAEEVRAGEAAVNADAPAEGTEEIRAGETAPVEAADNAAVEEATA